MSGGIRPPPIAEALLRWCLPAVDRDVVADDLAELFQIRGRRTKPGANGWWYRRQVASFVFRLVTRGGAPSSGASGNDPHQDSGIRRRRARGGAEIMGIWTHEMRQGFRRLRRAPLFLVVSVLTVGVGIGAFGSIFGLAEAVVLEPMNYKSPDQLVWVWRDYTWASFPRGWLGGPDIAGLREQSEVFEGVVASQGGRLNLTGSDGSAPEQVRATWVSHELFDILGVQPFVGRGFAPEEDSPDAEQVAVLSYDFWHGRFNADPNLLGETVFLNGAVVTVIGVAPEDFHFVRHASLGDPGPPPDMYLNLRLVMADQPPGNGSYGGLARIRPGVTEAQLEAALAAGAKTADDRFGNRGLRLWSVGLKEDLTEKVRPTLTALLGSAAFLLLILSANLATLLLGRAAVRERELGVSSALGAGKGRLLMGVLSESLIIGFFGAAIGIGLTVLGTDVVVAMAPENLPRLRDVGVDASVVAVALAVTLGMTVAAGILPGMRVFRSNPMNSMRSGGARAGGSLQGARARSALVVAQVGLSLMLLVGAGLMVQAFAGLLRQDPGFDPGSTLTFQVPLDGTSYPDQEATQVFHDRLSEQLKALPGVTAVGASNALPLTQGTNQTGVVFPGAPGNIGDPDVDQPLIDWFRVTDDYFEAAGLRLMAGRAFEPSDVDERVRSIIIDDVLARQFFPDGSAVGSLAGFGSDSVTIVGVVDQPRLYSVHSDDRGQVFVPSGASGNWSMSYALRTETDPTALIAPARAALRSVDPTVPMPQVRTLDAIVRESLGQQELSLTLLGGFGLAALLLATLGLYGVVANGVVRRKQEMGVRMALGAEPRRVLNMVLSQGLRLAAVGALLGLIGAVAASRAIEGVMVGVEARNPTAYVGAAVVLLLVAAAASYLPARRATKIDPIEALRPE